ncbi:uncharacterized protein TM35_000231060 [Trypanosoma theileri]|uniref:Uncharacterized protein n=1 Tax=Trypanosoma theileri TaxID=67003 RepID=A0A1X0NQZ6_9TRYP|nr:uncharacterized protein TM35_000231060 [Trypanosoma theileri]ORC87135.1 hypothetical protein TM35_000231060 [Trypanosoma theileri]
MESSKLLYLVEKCYRSICVQGRPLFLDESGDLCISSSEIISAIRDSATGTARETPEGSSVSISCILLCSPVTPSRVKEASNFLVVLLSCRLFSTLRNLCNELKPSLITRRIMVHALSCVKHWINEAFVFLNVSPLRELAHELSILQVMESILSENNLLIKKCCSSLARYLVTATLQQKKLFFLAIDPHGEKIDSCFGLYRKYLDEPLIVDNAVLICISLSIEAKLLLFNSNNHGGNLLLFSCSLKIRGKELETFLSLLQTLNIVFVASQRLLDTEVKESLFDLGIVPLERLSLNYTHMVELVTGATPFHSFSEFLLSMNSGDMGIRNTRILLGFVQKVSVLDDERIWLYGKKDVATVLIPVYDPVAHSSVVKICEKALHIAHNALSGVIEEKLELLGVSEVFFAQYLHHRYTQHHDKNEFLQAIVYTLRFTLLSNAYLSKLTLCENSHDSFLKLISEVGKSLTLDSASSENKPKNGDIMNPIPPFDEMRCDYSVPFTECAAALKNTMDGVSLLFRIKEWK